MISKEQNAANLRSAEKIAAIQLGVDDQGGNPLNALSYEQRSAYAAKLSKIILENPDRFAPGTVATARGIAAKKFSPLDDTSFDWGDFSSNLADEAVELGGAVAAVGEGVKNGLKLTSWLIPLALVAVVIIALVGFKKRVGA
jgi:hypothetical protein